MHRRLCGSLFGLSGRGSLVGNGGGWLLHSDHILGIFIKSRRRLANFQLLIYSRGSIHSGRPGSLCSMSYSFRYRILLVNLLGSDDDGISDILAHTENSAEDSGDDVFGGAGLVSLRA